MTKTIPCPNPTPTASERPLWTPYLPLRGGGVKYTGSEGWELLLEAAMLKNIMHTFPSRSLLGNTDTVWFLVSGSVE